MQTAPKISSTGLNEPSREDINRATGNDPAFEKQLADAYRHLEYTLPDLKTASIIVEFLMDDAIGSLGEPVEGNSELARFDLTKDQQDALIYSVKHLSDLCRSLQKLYFRGFEEARTASVAA